MTAATLWHRAESAYQRRASRWFGRRMFEIPEGRAIISFTFDDFPRSALDVGGSLLAERGLAGTYYASLGLAGRVTPTGQMFELPDVVRAVEQGHELGCHTYHHRPSWETDADAFEASIRQNAEALRAVTRARFLTLSYPINSPRPETKGRMGRYFACCRGGGQSFNIGTVDLNYLNAFFLEQCGESWEVVRDLIRATCREGGWLIFATHDIADRHTRFGCTPGFFEQVVAGAVDSGAEILPMFEAWARLQHRAAS